MNEHRFCKQCGSINAIHVLNGEPRCYWCLIHQIQRLSDTTSNPARCRAKLVAMLYRSLKKIQFASTTSRRGANGLAMEFAGDWLNLLHRRCRGYCTRDIFMRLSGLVNMGIDPVKAADMAIKLATGQGVEINTTVSEACQ